MEASVYIDGFNLYFGCLIDSPYKWLDLHELARRLVPEHEIEHIHYFTARVHDTPKDLSKSQRQDVFLRALRTNPNVTIHYGTFLSHQVYMRPCYQQPGGPKRVCVIKTEEKGSDVNLATQLVVDGFDGKYKAAVVISNDSDLTEPIRVTRSRFGCDVIVVNPSLTMSTSKELQSVASACRTVRKAVLAACQLPAQLQDTIGTITKPATW